MKEDADNAQINEYDLVPVLYCKHCLSLRVMSIPDDPNSDFCDDCCGTDIGECNIHEWEEMYSKKYGKKYINN